MLSLGEMKYNNGLDINALYSWAQLEKEYMHTWASEHFS